VVFPDRRAGRHPGRRRRHGVFAANRMAASATFLTSLIDSKGNLQVQYLGYLCSEEFRHDLLDLVGESRQD
jgi:hypothetical protein